MIQPARQHYGEKSAAYPAGRPEAIFSNLGSIEAFGGQKLLSPRWYSRLAQRRAAASALRVRVSGAADGYAAHSQAAPGLANL